MLLLLLLLLTLLGPSLSFPADDSQDWGHCSQCFYKQTPPQISWSSGTPLHPRCHQLPRGQMLATLSKETCDTAVYCAFYLGHGQTETKEEEEEEEKEVHLLEVDGVKVVAPSFLMGPSAPVQPNDPALQHWDTTLTELFQSSVGPQCSTLGGDLYILTGVGGCGGECQTEPLWSAFCCAAPDGTGGFSGGLIRETGGEDRRVSTRELQELLGGGDMFLEGCGAAPLEAAVAPTTSVIQERTQETEMDDPQMEDTDKAEDLSEPVSENQAREAPEVRSREEPFDVGQSGSVSESEEKQEAEDNSTSILVYLLSTTVSILKAPLHPLVSTATHLPGQVSYVLQEDLGVLSTLPGHTFSLLHLLASDLCSWVGSAADVLLSVGGTCCSNLHCCVSSMLGALLSSCQTGVTGLGTLAGDTLGVFVGALDNAWWVTRFFGGQLWDNSEGYVVSVVSELGGQTKAVGGGLWRLMWRSGNGVCNVCHVGGRFIFGFLDLLMGTVSEAFAREPRSDEGLESVLKN